MPDPKNHRCLTNAHVLEEMPVISTVQVTSYVQFDGDETTAVHTRTVVEILEDGDVLIEDSAEIDNAANAICVRQSAQVDTECSQMLLHSETQQDRPEFDPKAPPSDVTVEQCSDLVENKERKEARTHVTISPNVKQAHEDSAGKTAQNGAHDGNENSGNSKRKSITDYSSLTQVSDLEKGLDEESAQSKAEHTFTPSNTTAVSKQTKPLPALPVTTEIPVKVVVQPKKSPPQEDKGAFQRQPEEHKVAGSSAERKKALRRSTKFGLDDVEATNYEACTEQGSESKGAQEHEVDITRINLPRVVDLLGTIRKKPEESSSQAIVRPAEAGDSQGAPEQIHHSKVEPPSFQASEDYNLTEDDRLSSESIRRRSLSQLGVRPKFSTLDLLTEDMSDIRLATRRTSLDLCPSPPQRQASLDTQDRPAEPRKVSFEVQPKGTTTHRSEGRSRPSKERRFIIGSPEDNSDNEEPHTSSKDSIFPKSTEDTPKKATKLIRKQIKPSLALRARIRRPSRNFEEELTKSSPRAARARKPKTSSVAPDSSPVPRKSVTKETVQKYTTKE